MCPRPPSVCTRYMHAAEYIEYSQDTKRMILMNDLGVKGRQWQVKFGNSVFLAKKIKSKLSPFFGNSDENRLKI